MHLNRPAQAAPYFSSAVGRFPLIADTMSFKLGEALFSAGRYDDALHAYALVIASQTSVHIPDAEVRRVECWIHQDKPAQASEEIRRLLGLGKNHRRDGRLLWLNTLILRQQGKTDDELALLRTIYLRHTDSPDYPAALSRIEELAVQGMNLLPKDTKEATAVIERFYETGRIEEALAASRYVRESKTEDELDKDIRRRLLQIEARALVRLQEYKASLTIVRSIGDQNGMARAYSRLNRHDLAAKAYAKAAKGSWGRTKSSAEFMSAWVWGEAGEFFKASQKLDDYSRSHRYRRQKAMWFAGWYAYRNQEYDRALGFWNDLTKRYRRTSYKREAAFWKARAFFQTDRDEDGFRLMHELAADWRFTYYRMASSYRLVVEEYYKKKEEEAKRKLQENSEAEQKTQPKQPEKPLSEEARIWARRKKRYYSWSKWDPAKFHKGVSRHVNDTLFADVDDVPEKIKKLAEKDVLFNHLRRSIRWLELAQLDEARADFTMQVRQIHDIWRNGKRPILMETPAEAARRADRLAYIKTYRKELAVMLIAYARGLGEYGLVHELAAFLLPVNGNKGVSRQQRLTHLYPPAYQELVLKYAAMYSVPPELAFAIMRVESRFKSDAVSGVGAVGLMQIMPYTAKRIADRLGEGDTFRHYDLYDPETSIRYGLWYIGQLLEKFQGQWPLAIASYNGGPHNVSDWLKRNRKLDWYAFIESIPFSQTRQYVKKVLSTAALYRYLYGGQFTGWNLNKTIRSKVEDNIDF